ncbi:MAG: signal recognition particle subunit SRP19/SEC65 family protein [Thermoplasmata archaeon]
MARDQIVIWPIYFDSRRSRKEGRRVPKKLAVPSPEIEAIAAAAEEAGYSVVLEEGYSHPFQAQSQKGRIRMAISEPKTQALRRIAEHLKDYLS